MRRSYYLRDSWQDRLVVAGQWGWRLAALLLAPALVGLTAKLIYLAFQLGWGLL